MTPEREQESPAEQPKPTTRREARALREAQDRARLFAEGEPLVASGSASRPAQASVPEAEPLPAPVPAIAPAAEAPAPATPASSTAPAAASAPAEANGVEQTPAVLTESVSEEQPKAAGRRGPVAAVLRVVATVVVMVVLCVAVVVGVAAIVIPAATGSTALTIQTGSMAPAYPPGTMVVVKPTPVEDLKPGDVVTYQLRSGEATLVTHRITQQLRTADGKPLFITQGDNNPVADETPVQPVQVRGKVWYAIPWIGWVATYVTGPWRAVVVPIAVGALLAYGAWMFIGSVRDRRKGKGLSNDEDTDNHTAGVPEPQPAHTAPGP